MFKTRIMFNVKVHGLPNIVTKSICAFKVYNKQFWEDNLTFSVDVLNFIESID